MIIGGTVQIVARHNCLRYMLGPESCIASPNQATKVFPARLDRKLPATRREDRYE
jgi:hypothetical protein